MKKVLLFPLLAIALIGCNNKDNEEKIIISKTHFTFMGDYMPNGLCRFYYKPRSWSDNVMFTERCDKYNIGDTIIGAVVKTKHYESRFDSVIYQIHLKDSLETERVKRLCDSVILILEQINYDNRD